MTDKLDMFRNRFAIFWMPPETDNESPSIALTSRHKKADGKMTQFNTGALIISKSTTVVATECQPYRPLPGWLEMTSPKKAFDRIKAAVASGFDTPGLIVYFRKGEFVIGDWVLSHGTQIVINQPDGPMNVVDLQHVDFAANELASGRARKAQEAAGLLRKRMESIDEADAIDGKLAKLSEGMNLPIHDLIDLAERARPIRRIEWDIAKLKIESAPCH
jgi:hypothetical protein